MELGGALERLRPAILTRYRIALRCRATTSAVAAPPISGGLIWCLRLLRVLNLASLRSHISPATNRAPRTTLRPFISPYFAWPKLKDMDARRYFAQHVWGGPRRTIRRRRLKTHPDPVPCTGPFPVRSGHFLAGPILGPVLCGSLAKNKDLRKLWGATKIGLETAPYKFVYTNLSCAATRESQR
jgi:hypothetical protein